MSEMREDIAVTSVDLVEHELFSIHELFHENTKMRRHSGRELGVKIEFIRRTPSLLLATSRAHKIYSTAPKIDLSKKPTSNGASLEEAILKRRSIRDFSGEAVSICDVAKLLALSNGITGHLKGIEGHLVHLRAAPSAGALYPIEIYLVVHNIRGLKKGLYHYNVRDHVLELLKTGDLRKKLASIAVDQEIVAKANMVFILSAVFDRAIFKYGERGYRYVLLDAGHIAQNVYLVATSMGLGACSIGGFYDDELNDILGIDGVDEATLYMIAVGKGKQEEGTVGDYY